jgi:quercetin dioxygenase-like cupin family protein
MSDRFEDHRGVIHDVFADIDAVTRITTVKGAVRGNHVHHKTTQWTLVLKGRLLMASGSLRHEVGPHEVATHPPGCPHAWKALEDTECLVFTKGPRSGENYETDTYRLDEPLLT